MPVQHSWRWGSVCGVLQPSLTSFPTAQAIIPPGTPRGFSPKARGCAAEALPRVHAQHINNPKGVVPRQHPGRRPPCGWIRRNGQRHHGFSTSQPTLWGASTRSVLRHNRVAVVAVFRYAPGVAPRRRNPGLCGRTPLVFGEGTVAWEGCGETWRDSSSCDIPDGATPGLGCETGMSGRANGERPGVARRTAQPGLGAQRPWALGRGKGRAANGR